MLCKTHQSERSYDLHGFVQIFIVREGHEIGLITARSRHELSIASFVSTGGTETIPVAPKTYSQAELRHNPEIALRE